MFATLAGIVTEFSDVTREKALSSTVVMPFGTLNELALLPIGYLIKVV